MQSNCNDVTVAVNVEIGQAAAAFQKLTQEIQRTTEALNLLKKALRGLPWYVRWRMRVGL